MLIVVLFLGWSLVVHSFVPPASMRGTKPCRHYPDFNLVDYDYRSEQYLQRYGLSGLGLADVTVVGLYLTDDEDSIAKGKKQKQLADALRNIKKKSNNKNFKVNTAAISYYSPVSCINKECNPNWDSWWSIFDWSYTNTCMDNIGGCSTGVYSGKRDPLLNENNWQKKFSSEVEMPLFQDEDELNVWDKFGGYPGDLFIYDRTGRLYAYVCVSPDVCDHPIPGNSIVTSQEGYDYVLEVMKEAGKAVQQGKNIRTLCERYDEGDDGYWGDQYWEVWAEDELEEGKQEDAPKGDDDYDHTHPTMKPTHAIVKEVTDKWNALKSKVGGANDNDGVYKKPKKSHHLLDAFWIISVITLCGYIGYRLWKYKTQRDSLQTTYHQFSVLPTIEEDEDENPTIRTSYGPFLGDDNDQPSAKGSSTGKSAKNTSGSNAYGTL